MKLNCEIQIVACRLFAAHRFCTGVRFCGLQGFRQLRRVSYSTARTFQLEQIVTAKSGCASVEALTDQRNRKFLTHTDNPKQ